MQLYLATISPVLAFSSMIQSDTLFGAFCWSLKYVYGEDELISFLEDMKQGKPSVIFSNGFPKDTLPLPLGVRDTLRNFEDIVDKTERKKVYQDNKKIKNARFVQKEWFLEIINGNQRGFTQGLLNDGLREQTTIHNMVLRDSGMVRKIEESGNLYESIEFFTENNQKYDVYILSSWEKDKLEQVIRIMFMLGIGKNKSIGKGAFELKKLVVSEGFKLTKAPNAYVALSNFIPASTDPIEGAYKTFVKFGKLDREYAASETPFKKPLLFLQAGAVFLTDEVKEYYGRCVENVSVQQKVITSGYTIAIPIYFEK